MLLQYTKEKNKYGNDCSSKDLSIWEVTYVRNSRGPPNERPGGQQFLYISPQNHWYARWKRLCKEYLCNEFSGRRSRGRESLHKSPLKDPQPTSRKKPSHYPTLFCLDDERFELPLGPGFWMFWKLHVCKTCFWLGGASWNSQKTIESTQYIDVRLD